MASFAGHRLILRDGSTIGVLAFFGKQTLSAGDEALLQTIADSASKVIQVSKSDEALRESEERLNSLYRTMVEGVCLHEMIYDGSGAAVDYEVTDVNPAYEAITGLSRERAVGSKGSELYGAGEAPFLDVYAKVADSGEPASFEAHFAPMEKYFSVSVSSSRKGQFATVFFDITDRKRAEDEWQALQRQVQHAQKLESLGVLAGGIAHDFNNLLMGILGNADLALNELSPMSPACRSLREIEKASLRAAELSKQMLAYSGRGRFVVEPISANELIEEMTHLLEVSISKKAVLKYNFAENLPSFCGDVTQVRQVVMNLITNASEAIGDKSGVIALSTGAMHCDRAYLDDADKVLRTGLEEPLPEGIYTYFEVADTGCGMDAATIEKIFDPFFTTKFTGRGLGMSAVLGIVRGHKGAMKIYSEVGKGTTFKILFPAIEVPDDGDAIEGQGEAEERTWTRTGTVLVADDEDVVCAVARKMLERLGFSVLTASDGHEALEIFRERADEIVCVLLDLTMPIWTASKPFANCGAFGLTFG